MRLPFVFLLLLAGCAGHVAPALTSNRDAPKPQAAPAPVAAAPAPVATPAPTPVAAATPAPAASCPTPAVASTDAAASEDDDSEAASDDDEGVAEEGESHEASDDPGAQAVRYTADLSDAELARLWKEKPQALGSISVGFVDSGRLINGEDFPSCSDGSWTVVSPEKAWATHETISYLTAAIQKVHEQFPSAPPLRVNQISSKEGGFLRPHKSHQNGRDVDIAFYYPTAEVVRARERERYIDVPKNWALLKAIITTSDVQLVLVDKRVQKVLYDYALRSGEDKAWLDSLFHAGHGGLIQHARRHRDHFHVRFFNPRAQELGRRLAPILAQQPQYNVAMHKVKHGDTLGHIALHYGTSVKAIQRENRLKNNFLRLGQVLSVPLHGACTHCPVPPAVVIPPRHLPPEAVAKQDAPAGISTALLELPAAPPPVAEEQAEVAVTNVASAQLAPASVAGPGSAVVPTVPASQVTGSGGMASPIPAPRATVAPVEAAVH